MKNRRKNLLSKQNEYTTAGEVLSKIEISAVFGDNDYIGEDGLLYCGNCNTPKEAYFANGQILFGRDRHPRECECRKEERKQEESERKKREHEEMVYRMKQIGLFKGKLSSWTFENAAFHTEQMEYAKRYVDHWKEMCKEGSGCLFWGLRGRGKTYAAASIANALIEQEIPVYMTNLARILKDIQCNDRENKNYYVERLCNYPLLIIDDLKTERDTSYAAEQVYDVINSRYLSGKPMIITTNLPLNELQDSEDETYARIYDRILEVCVPVRFAGEDVRKKLGQERFQNFKDMLK
jgi:DNA replication protein DnaC